MVAKHRNYIEKRIFYQDLQTEALFVYFLGMVMVNVLPFPGALSTVTDP